MLLPSLLVALALGNLPRQEFDPTFDYTHLRPSDQELWLPLSQAQVSLEQAIELAQASEGPLKVIQAAPKQTYKEGEARSWFLQAFKQVDGKPVRVDVEVAQAQPEILLRYELGALAPGEAELFAALSKIQADLVESMGIARERTNGEKDEKRIPDPRVNAVHFKPQNGIYELEILGFDTKSEIPRRYLFEMNPAAPRVARKTLVDRFPGTPLRDKVMTTLPSGLMLCDLTEGDGALIAADSVVEVNYRLMLLDGTKLHDSYETRVSESFALSDAPLRGIAEGLPGMRVGGKRKLAIPFELAFGEQANELAPPRAMVVCDISVLSLNE